MRLEKLRKELLLRVGDLLADHMEEIEKAAADSLTEDNEVGAPLKAKAGLSLTWDAGSSAPEIRVRIAYSTRHQQDMRAEIDLDQQEMQVVWGPAEAEGGAA